MPEVFLRKLQIDDARVSYKWRNNPEIWKYTKAKPDRYITEEMELSWIEGVLKRKTEKRYAICLRDSNEYIGNTHFSDISSSSAELHIFIGNTKYWGLGIGKKATELLVEIGFYQLSLDTIYLKVHEDNKNAIAIYQNIGFKYAEKTDSQIKMILRKDGY